MSSESSATHVSSYFKYHVKFDDKTIETIVTNERAVADAWVKEILVAHAENPKVVVGFHVKWYEWTSSTSGKCSTLQLCIDTKCIILQLKHIDEISQSIKDFLMNPNITFVGAHEDFTKFVGDYGLDCAKSEDIRAAVIRKWPRRFQRHDLEYLAKELAGLKLDKPCDTFLTGWGNQVLDIALVDYACIVAYASYKIGHALFAET
ncbi:3'-5' exonuclease domain-containing protein [Artemisia annua]|uniref:3'-5' exonuclease domain-containing protein n=1 Tax=Artemisia annua TaxID=35608 RepID=A0A2U1LZ05_ARTAN|nr:3'-5' exonuclease domain-containing protein [Artemisia annua]